MEDLFRHDVTIKVIKTKEPINKVKFHINDQSLWEKITSFISSKENILYYFLKDGEYYGTDNGNSNVINIHKHGSRITVGLDYYNFRMLSFVNDVDKCEDIISKFKEDIINMINKLEDKIKEQNETNFVKEVRM